jgi:hypothetical protein
MFILPTQLSARKFRVLILIEREGSCKITLGPNKRETGRHDQVDKVESEANTQIQNFTSNKILSEAKQPCFHKFTKEKQGQKDMNDSPSTCVIQCSTCKFLYALFYFSPFGTISIKGHASPSTHAYEKTSRSSMYA